MKKPLLLTLILSLYCILSYGQEDVTFWFVAPEVSQTGTSNLDRPIFLRLTAFASAATVTISQPAGGGMPTTVLSIAANSTVSFDLTPWIDMVENKPGDAILNYGIKIQSTAPISAYYSVVSGACLCNPEDFVLKGRNALGTDFWIPGQNTLYNSLSYTPTPHNAFDIVATQNGTTVTITPAQDIVGHTAGITYSIVLNAGQTYSATAAGTLAAQHLVGSRVTSDKPIAITEKDDLLWFVSLGIAGADLIGDQIVPTNVCGTEYIPIYGALTTPGDQLFITATQPGTTISVNGVLVSTLATAGSTYQMTAPSPTCYIQTNFPVYVYHLSGIHSEVGSALLPQINCTGSNSVSIQQSSTIDFQVNLLVKTVGTGGFLVNGVAGVITPAMFATVPSTGGVWSAARVTLPVSSYPIGTVLTISNVGNLFQMGYLSSGPVGSGASFGYFSNYGGINPDPRTTTPSVCVGDSIKLFSDTISAATYLWIGPDGFTSTLQNPFISGSIYLDSGVYKIYVNTPGCADSGTVAVAVHPYPDVNLGNDTLICGSATITLKDLDVVYATDTYLWSTGATSPTITVSGSGTYWLAATNAGCSSTDTIHVAIVPLIAPAVTTPVTYCQYDAAVPLTATGTGLRWYTTATGGTFTTTAPTPSTTVPGTYSYYVSSTLGPCESARAPITVVINALPSPPSVVDPNPYCFGQPFVPFTVTGTGVLWYNNATGGVGTAITPTVNTSIPGNDTFYATQTVSGCEGPRGMTVITVLNPITSGFSYGIHLGCKGDTVDFTNSSTGAIKYLWLFGDGYSDTAANPMHIYRNQGTFTVKLTSVNGQCDDSAIQTISLIHPLKAGFTFTPEIVCQKNPVMFTDTSIGSGLSYEWIFGNGDTSSAANAVYTYNNSGVYHVRLVVTNAIPCHDTATGTVYVDSTTAIGLVTSDSVLCRSTYITFTGLYTSIGDTGVTWNFGDGDSILNINPVSHSFDGMGDFVVTVTPHYRVCRDTSISKHVNIIGAPTLYLGDDTSICPGGEGIVIGDNVNQNNPLASWKWSTGQTSPKITVVAPGTYYAQVNVDGCFATDTIQVQNDCYINIPNVFTPNGDGLNDYFFPRQYLARGLVAFKMDIYNRWGQLIFETVNLDGAGWDGKFNNTEQPVGVYVYVIDATFKDGQKEHRQGNVTLLR